MAHYPSGELSQRGRHREDRSPAGGPTLGEALIKILAERSVISHRDRMPPESDKRSTLLLSCGILLNHRALGGIDCGSRRNRLAVNVLDDSPEAPESSHNGNVICRQEARWEVEKGLTFRLSSRQRCSSERIIDVQA
ncbi:hypothetical protein AOLI_G00314570 [Acnodon oligacanthus]